MGKGDGAGRQGRSSGVNPSAEGFNAPGHEASTAVQGTWARARAGGTKGEREAAMRALAKQATNHTLNHMHAYGDRLDRRIADKIWRDRDRAQKKYYRDAMRRAAREGRKQLTDEEVKELRRIGDPAQGRGGPSRGSDSGGKSGGPRFLT